MLVLTRRTGETLMIDDTALTILGIYGNKVHAEITTPDGNTTQQKIGLDDHPMIDETTITISGIKGRQVKLGIVAPRTVKIYRLEIYQRIQQERKAA